MWGFAGKFFSNPAIVTGLSGCGVKNTPPLGEFGVSPLEAIEDRENETFFFFFLKENLRILRWLNRCYRFILSFTCSKCEMNYDYIHNTQSTFVTNLVWYLSFIARKNLRMRKSRAQCPNGRAISTRHYGSLTVLAIKAPEFSNVTFCCGSHRTSAHQYYQYSLEQLHVACRGCDFLY